ncbi:stage II sporulation protein P [Alteribacillus persepolensis]|uniref:Stage II sporulation protein P n=1 Tax=Alteribacillus persepolensis TaxID=568899 RepID=A0A1G8CQG2_9BACI|nr:stage II sporulation protein P [Alteribacillus persepolensis]SDH47130.1 stage II sporulation protein P [Alteribacillus persepolensis]
MTYHVKKKKTTQNRLSIKQIAAVGLSGYLFIMFFIAVLTSVEHDRYFSSRNLHTWSTQIQHEWLTSFFVYENRHYLSAEDINNPPALSQVIFEFATRLDMQDPRTLLGRELPGFASFDGKIVVAGDGTDFTNMPVESAPPMEVLMEEREATSKRLELAEEDERNQEQQTTGQAPVAHIIHSHSRESYLPELKDGTTVAFHPEVNITLVGDRLGQKLEEHGISTKVDKTDIEQKLHENGWDFPRSYDVSREVLQDAMAEHEQLELFFDLHRDSQTRDITTVTINGETMARTMFVIGENNPHYEKNLEMATDMHNRLEESYPGLSRGVITKGGGGANGRYNQDLSEKSVLIEMGGIENNLEEAYRTADILAEVISEQYFDAQSVEGGE